MENNTTGEPRRPPTPKSVDDDVVKRYGKDVGIIIDMHRFFVYSLQATTTTNDLAHQADIATVRDWLGHAHIATTKIYDKRRSRPEESATFRVEN